MSTAAERMHRIFGSAKHKHYIADFSKGKWDGKKFVPEYKAVDGSIKVEEFEQHLRGEISILAVPVNEMGQTRWGKIDVDEYPVDSVALAIRIKNLNLPLIVEQTKSGGVHLAYYSKQFESAGVLREKLSEWAATLRYSGVEIFPKQDILMSGDTGSGINVPYMGGDAAKNFAVNAEGEKISLHNWLELIENPPVEVRYTPGTADVKAAAEYLAQFWVDGKRDRLNIALIGTLMRADIEEGTIAELISTVQSLCLDREHRKSVVSVRQDMDRGKRVPGFTSLIDPQNDFMKREEAMELMRLMGASAPPPPKPQVTFDIVNNPREWWTVAPPPMEWTAGKLFPRGTVAVLASEGGSGKTAFIQHIELGVATGRAMFGMEVTKGKVVHLAMEDRDAPLRRRAYWLVQNEVKRMTDAGATTADLEAFHEDVANNLIVVPAAGSGLRLLLVDKGVVVINNAAIAELIAKLPAGLELLTLDPMARLSGAPENANEVGTAFVDACERIAREVGCAVVILHHTGKGREDDESAYASRGGSALPDAARSSVRLLVVTEKGDMDISDEVIAAGNLVKVIHNKCNDGPRAKPFFLLRTELSFELFVPRITDAAEQQNEIILGIWKWYVAAKSSPFDRTTISERLVIEQMGLKCSRDKMRDIFSMLKRNGDLLDTETFMPRAKYPLVRFRDGFQPPNEVF